jgi:hypothetical protein
VPRNVRVITSIGQVILYDSLEEAVSSLGPWVFRNGQVSNRPISPPIGGWSTTNIFLPRVYQVYSDGVFVPAIELVHHLPSNTIPRCSWKRSYSHIPVFRQDAIPWTGHRPAGHHMFRRPGTIGLLRETSFRRNFDENDFPIPPVRARLGRHPSSWDDLGVAANRQRCWKRHRRYQWRPSP